MGRRFHRREQPEAESLPRERQSGLHAAGREILYRKDRNEHERADRYEDGVSVVANRQATRARERKRNARDGQGQAEADAYPFEFERQDAADGQHCHPRGTRECLDALSELKTGPWPAPIDLDDA